MVPSLVMIDGSLVASLARSQVVTTKRYVPTAAGAFLSQSWHWVHPNQPVQATGFEVA